MKGSFFSALFALALSLVLLPQVASRAQESDPLLFSTLNLEAALTQLEAGDAIVCQKLDELKAVADKEVTEGRLTAEAARTFANWLSLLRSELEFSLRETFPRERVPLDNEAVAALTKPCEKALEENRLRRYPLLKVVKEKAADEIAKVVRSAKTVEDIDSFLPTLERLKRIWPVRNFTSRSGQQFREPGYTDFRKTFTALRRLLEVQASPAVADAQTMRTAMSELRDTTRTTQPVIRESDVLPRLQTAVIPFIAPLDEALATTDRLFREGRPMAEIAAARTRLDATFETLRQLDAAAYTAHSKRSTEPIALYKLLSPTYAAIEAGSFEEAAKQMKVLRKFYNYTEPGGFTKTLSLWDERIARGLSDAAATRTSALKARLAAVSTPAEMQELGAELSQRESKSSVDSPTEFPIGLGKQLTMVAAAWASASAAPPSIFPSSDTRLAAELDALETKVQRDMLASALRAPQLNQAPLDALSIEDALDQLNAQMAQKGEWRGLLALIEARAKFGRLGALPQKDRDLPTALRAYFEGQNLELSEQWPEARTAYQTVLRSTSELAPIKDTVERLKKLTKEHFPSTVSADPAKTSPQSPAK